MAGPAAGLPAAEAKGELRGGRFVTGFVGEQFALPEAVEALRAVPRAKPNGFLSSISACDSLNVAGVLTPGPRVPAVLGNRVIFATAFPWLRLRAMNCSGAAR